MPDQSAGNITRKLADSITAIHTTRQAITAAAATVYATPAGQPPTPPTPATPAPKGTP